MFAVIKTGGKQYKVRLNDTLSVEKLDKAQGDKFNIDEILMIHNGEKSLFGKHGTVEAEIIEHYKDDKILIFKKRRRKNYRRMNGHRQNLTKIQIKSISL